MNWSYNSLFHFHSLPTVFIQIFKLVFSLTFWNWILFSSVWKHQTWTKLKKKLLRIIKSQVNGVLKHLLVFSSKKHVGKMTFLNFNIIVFALIFMNHVIYKLTGPLLLAYYKMYKRRKPTFKHDLVFSVVKIWIYALLSNKRNDNKNKYFVNTRNLFIKYKKIFLRLSLSTL